MDGLPCMWRGHEWDLPGDGEERGGTQVGPAVGGHTGTSSSGGGDGCGVTHLGGVDGTVTLGRRETWVGPPAWHGAEGHDQLWGEGGIIQLRGDGWDHLPRACGVMCKGC